MTDVDELLRSTMRSDRSKGPGRSGTESGWQAIEAAAARRTRRRQTGQRVGLLLAIAVTGATMMRTLTAGSGEQTTTTPPPALAEAAAGGGSAWLSGWTVAALLAATLTILVVILPTRDLLRRALDNPARLVALTAVLIGLALPTWAYGNYVQSIGELQRRMPDLERVESLDVVSVERTWSPFVGPTDPLLTVVAAPAGSATEADARAAAIDELLAAGMQYVSVRDSYERATDPTNRSEASGGSPADNWNYHDAATVDIDDGTVRVGYRLRPETSRTWIPLATFGATFIIAVAALGLLGGRLARPVGLAVLAATAGQFGLVVRAYSTARSLLVNLDLNDRLAPERAEVSAATTDVYPLGLLAVVLLLVPWLLGAVAVCGHRLRLLVPFVAVGIVAVVLVFVAFGSINGVVLDILE